jgi:high affinity sulfate transporter 1
LRPEWLREYRLAYLRSDLIAGLTAAAVVLPMALAYATLAGLPVQAGLYTAMAPMLIYAWLGTSRPLSLSTTATIAILTGTALAPFIQTHDNSELVGITAALSFMVGTILLFAGMLRLGFMADFLSAPVLVGYQAGMGVVIVLDQIPKLLGTTIIKGNFLHNLIATLSSLPDTSLVTLLCSVFALLIILASKRLIPKIPAPLVVVGVGITAMSLLELQRYGVATVGNVPIGFPGITIPDWKVCEQLWPAATGIALMSFTSTIAAGRGFVRSDEATPQANRELLAIGGANIAGAFLSAMPASGGSTQTAINAGAGAHTQVSQCVTSIIAMLIALLLAPRISLMPESTLATIILVYSIAMIRVKEFRNIYRVRKTEFIWAVVAVVGVVWLGTLQGIIVAIIVSLISLAYQMADPPVYQLVRKPGSNIYRPKTPENPDDESFPGLLLLHPEGRLFFANAERISQKMRPMIFSAMQPKVVVLDLSGIFDMEYTALRMLVTADQHLMEKGITLWLVGLNPQVQRMVANSHLGTLLGDERMFPNLESAVERYQTGR